MRFWLSVYSLAWLIGCCGVSAWGAEVQAAPTPVVAHASTAQHDSAGITVTPEGLPSAAVPIFTIGPLDFTNSMLVTWGVALGLIVFARIAMRRMEAVPSGAQNFWEWLVETLYDFLEGMLGRDLTRTTFWFFATIFIFILFTNWFGLIPGVGSIGWGVAGKHGFQITRPLLRDGNADLNMPAAMAMIFMVCWTVWAFRYNGLKGVLMHLFAPKGESAGAMFLVMVVLFFLIGLLDLISIAFRPISLSFRLYGNMFAGENLLEAMSHMIKHPAWAQAVFSAVLPVPFYFMEMLVGLVQSLIFMLLTAVFTLIICVHVEHEGEGGHA